MADLRFARPTDVKPWQGERLALSTGFYAPSGILNKEVRGRAL